LSLRGLYVSIAGTWGLLQVVQNTICCESPLMVVRRDGLKAAWEISLAIATYTTGGPCAKMGLDLGMESLVPLIQAPDVVQRPLADSTPGHS
jgi:hypothetical protein